MPFRLAVAALILGGASDPGLTSAEVSASLHVMHNDAMQAALMYHGSISSAWMPLRRPMVSLGSESGGCSASNAATDRETS